MHSYAATSPSLTSTCEAQTGREGERTASTFVSHQHSPPTGAPQELGDSVSDLLPVNIFPCPGEPSPSQAEEYLTTFRMHMLRFFPIFHLPESMTSWQLKEERPFLWLCIMSVACPSAPEQSVLGDNIRGIVGRELIYNSKKSVDLLLGLLVFTAWCVHSTTRKYPNPG